jgi:hypothetical protein
MHFNSLPSSGLSIVPGATYSLSVGARALIEEQLDFTPSASDLLAVRARTRETRRLTQVREESGEWITLSDSVEPPGEATFSFRQGSRTWRVSFSVERAWQITRASAPDLGSAKPKGGLAKAKAAKPSQATKEKGKINIAELFSI